MTDRSFYSLADKVAIVTGAAHGIGASIAERFLKAGAQVVFADIDADGARERAGQLDGSGDHSLVVSVDLTRSDEVANLVERVLGRFGTVDILVNNAGIVGPTKPLVEVSEEEWNQVMAVNLRGVFLCCRSVLPTMLKHRSGRIVNVASIAGKEGNPNLAPYSTTKAGVICLTKALAKEVCQNGVYVNCVTPAVIDTPILRQVGQETVDYMISKIPMGRVGKPEEVAALIHFLASDECSFTNGACVDISGARATY